MSSARVRASTTKLVVLFALASPQGHAEDFRQCTTALAPSLSSMIYYWVPNRGSEPVDPATASILRRIRPGGVLLSGDGDRTVAGMAEFTESIRKIYSQAGAPTPFIGADFLNLKGEKQDPRIPLTAFGFGTRVTDPGSEKGSSGDRIKEACERAIARVKALVHRIVGINHPLGPQIDEAIKANGQRTPGTTPLSDLAKAVQESGTIPTLKHYPFTVQGSDGHKTTLSPNVSISDLENLERAFFGSMEGNYVVMTTHLGIQQIDGGNLATFSKPWVERVRKRIGPANLIMTDGLFMIAAYPKYLSQMSGLSEDEVRAYFSGNVYSTHQGPELFPWKYGSDPVFQAVKGVLSKWNGLKLRSDEDERYTQDLLSQDPAAKERVASRNQRYQEFSQDIANAIRAKYNASYVHKKVEFSGTAFDVIEFADPKAKSAYLKALGYSALLNGRFDPSRVHEISARVVSSFAERAIVSGHDLLVIEGNPIDKIYDQILRDACTGNAELQSRIRESGSRIAAFKEKSARELNGRASKEWIEANRQTIERLGLRVLPNLHHRLYTKNSCREQDIREAESTVHGLESTLAR